MDYSFRPCVLGIVTYAILAYQYSVPEAAYILLLSMLSIEAAYVIDLVADRGVGYLHRLV